MDKVCFFYFVILCTVSREMKAKEVASDTAADMNDRPQYLGGYMRDQEILDDYGLIPFQKWNSTDELSSVSYESSLDIYLTNSMGCYNLSSCWDILKEISENQTKEYGQVTDHFHILPDGRIVEDLGWGEVNVSEFGINLFADGNNNFPSNETLEAFAYLVQFGRSLGKIKFRNTITADELSEPLLRELYELEDKYRIKLNSDNTIERLSIYDDQVISRVEWKASIPMREFKMSKGKAEMVEIYKDRRFCYSTAQCMFTMRWMQGEEISSDGDVFPNFVIGGDGRIYEGLGWNYSRKERVVYFAIPALDGRGHIPWSHVMAAFTLQLRNGVDLGWISENYMKDIYGWWDNDAVLWWVEWAMQNLRKNGTINMDITGGDHITVVHKLEDQLEVIPLKHPVGTIYFTQSDAGCSKLMDCLPFLKSIGGKTLRSKNQVKSNFYFADEGNHDMVVHEGLGWNQTTKMDHVVFEFLTPDVDSMPSNRSILASTFLIREALKNGIIEPDYRIIFAEHISNEFKNLFRFLDERLKKPFYSYHSGDTPLYLEKLMRF